MNNKIWFLLAPLAGIIIAISCPGIRKWAVSLIKKTKKAKTKIIDRKEKPKFLGISKERVVKGETVLKKPREIGKKKRKEKTEGKKEQEREKESPLLDLKKVDKKWIKDLEKAGFKNIESLSEAPVSRLMEILKIELRQAADLINEARGKLEKLGSAEPL